MTDVRRGVLFAEYGQFLVQDADAHDSAMSAGAAMDPDRPAGGWTEDAAHLHRIGLEPHSISVGTAREDLVETVLTVHAGPPPLPIGADHVVEADLDVPTGAVSIIGCTQPPRPEHALTVTPGLYRTRVCYVPSSPPVGSNPDALGDHFSYEIDIWPTTEPRALTVIKQGPSPWGG